MHGTATIFSAFVFAWQLFGAGRTFSLPKGERIGLRHQLVPFLFVLVLLLSFSSALQTAFVVPGFVGLGGALVLFEWARRSIRGHYFSYVFSQDVPAFLWTHGPFAHIRNPFYTSYLLSAASVALMFPTLPVVIMWLILVVFSHRAARHEERKFLSSPLRSEYEAYAGRTGRFLPGVGRLQTGQS